MPYMTDKEIEQKQQIFALVCLGGLSEGFDYSDAKEKLIFWSRKRRELMFCGGNVELPKKTK